MKTTIHHPWPRLHSTLVAGTLLAFLVLACVPLAQATEIIPSVGITKSARDDNANAEVYGGLAVRGNILPLLKTEVGIAYRHEDRLGGDLVVRQWPVTASLWLAPIPALYAGGGVGWYHTTLDYSETLPLTDETHQRFGVHLGGGVEVPLGPSAAVDLNGRYVYLDNETSQLPPAEFDPDFWTTTVGLAIRF
jgi:hypothetical protein